MHIYEGVLAATAHGQEVLIAGAAATAVGTAIGLYKIDQQKLPQVAVLSSAFFVVSLIQVPFLGTSVHLVLTGLIGLVLGWAAFPAVLVALLLQAVFFSIGGLTALGVNTLTMAGPAVLCHYVFRRPARSGSQKVVFAAGFAAGATAVVLGSALAAGALVLAGKPFAVAGWVLLGTHLPTALVEGLVTGNVVVLLRKARPEVLRSLLLAPIEQEAIDG
jgi:cobalt/nickel transport system permease protein